MNTFFFIVLLMENRTGDNEEDNSEEDSKAEDSEAEDSEAESESASDMDVDLPGTFYSYNVIILN